MSKHHHPWGFTQNPPPPGFIQTQFPTPMGPPWGMGGGTQTLDVLWNEIWEKKDLFGELYLFYTYEQQQLNQK